MNLAKLKSLKDVIRNPNSTIKFSMNEWVRISPGCGTFACIAGHIALQKSNEYLYIQDNKIRAEKVVETFAEYLECSAEDAKAIAMPGWGSISNDIFDHFPQEIENWSILTACNWIDCWVEHYNANNQ